MFVVWYLNIRVSRLFISFFTDVSKRLIFLQRSCYEISKGDTMYTKLSLTLVGLLLFVLIFFPIQTAAQTGEETSTPVPCQLQVP